MFKYSKSIFSFSLNFLILISGVLIKFLFSDVVALESDSSVNLDSNLDNSDNSDQSFKDKVKNLPWKWIFLITVITIGSGLYFYFNPEQPINFINLPTNEELREFYMNIQGEYLITKGDFAAAPQWVRYYFFFEKQAKLMAFKSGLVEGSPEFKDFVLKSINDHMALLPS